MTHAKRHWASVLNEAWGIDAVLQPLPGEFDLNFLATARDGSGCVLKVMREGCAAEFVSLLCAAHAHVRSRDATVTVPAVVPTTAGESDGVQRALRARSAPIQRTALGYRSEHRRRSLSALERDVGYGSGIDTMRRHP